MERGARCSHFVVGADHGIPAAEIDCVFKIDRTPAIFRLSQGGGNVWHLDEAKVHDDLPKPPRRVSPARCAHEVRRAGYPRISPSARLRFLTALLRHLLMHPRCSHESTKRAISIPKRPQAKSFATASEREANDFPSIDPIIAAMISAIWCFQFSGFIFCIPLALCLRPLRNYAFKVDPSPQRA